MVNLVFERSRFCHGARKWHPKVKNTARKMKPYKNLEVLLDLDLAFCRPPNKSFPIFQGAQILHR